MWFEEKKNCANDIDMTADGRVTASLALPWDVVEDWLVL